MVEWSRIHGFWGGIVFWLKHGPQDPILLAAEIDFLAFMTIVGLLLLKDYFSLRGKIGVIFAFWCALYILFPSLGILSYIFYLRPSKALKSGLPY